jgi:hypothetical protein
VASLQTAVGWSEEVVRRWGKVFPSGDKQRKPLPVCDAWAQDRFQDAQWANSPSPKTAHYHARVVRAGPIFPELLPILRQAHEDAPERARSVVERDRNPSAKVRSAAIGARPFQNCRSTDETELVETFPVHVAAVWLGNTPEVATKHYLQVTAEHFREATSIGGHAKSAARLPEVAENAVGCGGEPKKRETPQILVESGATALQSVA